MTIDTQQERLAKVIPPAPSPAALTRLRRRVRSMDRRLRETRLVARAFKSGYHPVLAHIVPTRRCNLACTYCNEFDAVSDPIPTDEMLGRVDALAGLGTTAVHLSGGEPLLHPKIDQIIRRIRARGMLAALLTNGYLLTEEWIKRLNRAGLDQLQISVDNVQPDAVSKKSLKVLDKKLVLLARYAEFDVSINSVLGADIAHPEDALEVTRRVSELGFTGTVGIIHDHSGQLRALSPEQRQIYDEITDHGTDRFYSFARYNKFQENILRGQPNVWECRAGSRYLYVCEDGLVHWCSQQRGTPGMPLAEYTSEELERQFHTPKPCAPLCTVSCVHRVSVLESFRDRPIETIKEMLTEDGEDGSLKDVPAPVRLLAWMFVQSRYAPAFKSLAGRVLGVR